MESLNTQQEQLSLLRQKDQAKAYTSTVNHLTPPQNLMDSLAYIFEIQTLGQQEELGKLKFQLKALCFRYIQEPGHFEGSQQQIFQKVLSCFHFILDIGQKWAMIEALALALESTQNAGYLGSPANSQIVSGLYFLAPNILELSTPYDFVELVLPKNLRMKMALIIDLSLLSQKISGMSAEEIFVGCCMYLNDISPVTLPLLGSTMSLNFEGAKVKGAEVQDALKELMENIEE